MVRAGMVLRVHRLAVQLFYPVKYFFNGTIGARTVPCFVHLGLDLPCAFGATHLVVFRSRNPARTTSLAFWWRPYPQSGLGLSVWRCLPALRWTNPPAVLYWVGI